MVIFEKLWGVEKQVDESCSDESAFKTVNGNGQDTEFIFKKNLKDIDILDYINYSFYF